MSERQLQNLFHSYEEQPQQVVGTVKGTLPKWLKGTLMRNGPAKWDLSPAFCLNHFFDGCALITKFDFQTSVDKPGQVCASSRYLRSDAYEKMNIVQRPVYTEFGTKAFPDTTKSLFSRLINRLVPSDLTDNDFANIYEADGETYVTTESCNIWKINHENLDSICKVNLDKHPGLSICSAHPLFSADEQVTYNVGSTFLTGMKYHVMKVPHTQASVKSAADKNSVMKQSKILCTINSSYSGCLAYSHSFAMSTNYLILVEQPFMVNAMKLITCTPNGKCMQECIGWDPDKPVRLHVVRKSDGTCLRTKFVTGAFFFLHTINAYEQDNHLVLDILAYEDPELFDCLKMDSLRQGHYAPKTPSIPKRFVLPLGDCTTMKPNENLVQLPDCPYEARLESAGTIRVHPHQLGPAGFENPIINPQYIGKKYQYVYGSGLFDPGFYANSVCKLDLNNNQVTLYKKSATEFPGEAVFVPKPGAVDEDDGVIITQVLNTDVSKNNYLAVLDAKTLDELATIEFDRKSIQLPPSIHGIWRWPAPASPQAK